MINEQSYSYILNNLIYILLSMFFTYIVYNFMSKFKRTLYYKTYAYGISYAIFTVCIYFTGVCSNSLSNIIISLIGTVIIGHFLFNNDKIQILYYCIFISVGCCLQLIISIMVQFLDNLFNISFASADFLTILEAIIFEGIAITLSKGFITFFEKKIIEKVTTIQYFKFLIFPLFSMFYISLLLIYIQSGISLGEKILLIINAVFIILLNLYITNVFEFISKSNIAKNEMILYKQQSELQYKYYNDLENKYRSSRKVIHDMKNHLQAVENLYKLQENEAAKKYTEDMYRLLEGLGHKYYCDNKVLNIIINDKVQNSKLENINIKCEIGDVCLDFIKDIDLTTIVANILDNSIEAAKKVDNNSYINLKIDKFNEFIVIKLVNSICSSPIEGEDGSLKSQKDNHEGIGLINVKKALQKYDGNIRIHYSEEVFNVNIVIPIS